MGIKTGKVSLLRLSDSTLKNLPTTWGLRPSTSAVPAIELASEKPPHHMGIKTSYWRILFTAIVL